MQELPHLLGIQVAHVKCITSYRNGNLKGLKKYFSKLTSNDLYCHLLNGKPLVLMCFGANLLAISLSHERRGYK